MLCFILFALFSQISVYEAKLDSLKKELENIRREKFKLEKQEKETINYLLTLDKEFVLLDEFLFNIKNEIKKTQKEKEEIEAVIKESEIYLSGSKDRIKSALLGLYRYGRTNRLFLFLTNFSPYTLYTGLKAISKGVGEEKRILEKGIYIIKNLKENRKELLKKEEKLISLNKVFEKKKEKMKLAEREKRKVLDEIRLKKDQSEKLILTLKKSMERINSIIKEMEEKRSKAYAMGKKPPLPKRNFTWPVSGKIICDFGTIWHPKYSTKTKNTGIDILASYSSTVKAADYGIVMWAGYLGLIHRKAVILDHGDGIYSIYINLKRIYVSQGAPVTKGQTIAELGSDPIENKPILHFEVRYGIEPVDPFLFLKETS